MNLNEFETQARDSIEQALNQLNTATLMVARLEAQLSEAGRTIQILSQQVEEFLTEQRQPPENSQG
jgi:exonuclease VII small subunit